MPPEFIPSTPPPLPAREIDRRLIALARAHQRLEASLCFCLQELDERALYSTLGFSSTLHYAKERLGFDPKKTRALLRMAVKFRALPKLGKAFAEGELPWTKVREAIKVATAESEDEWIRKCRELSNRQIEQEVRHLQAPVKRKTLVFVLEADQVETWEQVREALARLSGMDLTDIEVFELMCAEVLGTYAATPPFGCEESDSQVGGYSRSIAERDGWKCVRPGCECRVGLQAHHIMSRARGGSDETWNLCLVCASCHGALTRGQIRVSGRAPDGLRWEASWGIIEKPLPLCRETKSLEEESASSVTQRIRQDSSGPELLVRETEPRYGLGPSARSRWDHVGRTEPSRSLSLKARGSPMRGLKKKSHHSRTGLAVRPHAARFGRPRRETRYNLDALAASPRVTPKGRGSEVAKSRDHGWRHELDTPYLALFRRLSVLALEE